MPELAEKSGINEKRVLNWVNRAALSYLRNRKCKIGLHRLKNFFALVRIG